jgi:hypothetical protein
MAIATPASAVPITVSGTLTSDHCDPKPNGCGAGTLGQLGGFGTVTVFDNGLGTGNNIGTLDFTVQLINNNKFRQGAAVTFGFDLIGNPTITYTNLPTSVPPGTWALPNSIGNTQTATTLQADGFGDLEYGIQLLGAGGSCNALCPSLLTFSISAAGLDWTDLGELSSQGNAIMVADIISGSTGNTGWVDLTTALIPGQQCTNCAAPGPIAGAGLPGLVVALFGMIGLARRRRNRQTISA